MIFTRMQKMHKNIKVIAMDLDGTLTQHKTKLDDAHKAALDALSKKYKLLMAGAGQVMRIFNQMDCYPIDIIGNYGMQYGVYNPETMNKEKVYKIMVDNRIRYFAPADYTENSEIDKLLKAIIVKTAAQEILEDTHEANLAEARKETTK